MRVAYTGEPGAFAEEAVLRFFAAPEPVPVSSFRAAFEAVRDGSAAAAVVPVESSLLGTIRENLDLLWEFELPIVGEVSVPVRLALLARPGERLETITRVYSISAALAQADAFLRSLLLHVSSDGDGVLGLLLLQEGEDEPALDLRIAWFEFEGLAQTLLRGLRVLVGHVRRREAKVRHRQERRQGCQLSERRDGLTRLPGLKLGAAERIEKPWAVRQHGHGGLRRRQRLFAVLGAEVELNQRQSWRRVGRIGLDGVVYQGGNLRRASTLGGGEIGEREQSLAFFRIGR